MTKVLHNMESMEEGGGHLDSLEEKDKEAGMLFAFKKYEEALKSFNDIYDILKSRYPLEPERPQNLIAQTNIAATLIEVKKYDEALHVLNEVDEIIERKDPASQVTAVAQHTRATLYQRKGKHVEALQLYCKAFLYFKKALGSEHTFTLTAQTNVAGLLHTFGKSDEALYMYNKAFERKLASLGPDNPSTLKTHHAIADIRIKKGECDDGINILREIYQKRCKTLGFDHPDTIGTAKSIQKTLSHTSK